MMRELIVGVVGLLVCACGHPKRQVRAIEVDGMVCGATCVDEDMVATAGHCVGRKDPIVFFEDSQCDRPVVRKARQGERVFVAGYPFGVRVDRPAIAVDPNWLGWLIVSGRGQHGESGGGVYGTDGALLGIAVETRDGLTYARLAVH